MPASPSPQKWLCCWPGSGGCLLFPVGTPDSHRSPSVGNSPHPGAQLSLGALGGLVKGRDGMTGLRAGLGFELEPIYLPCPGFSSLGPWLLVLLALSSAWPSRPHHLSLPVLWAIPEQTWGQAIATCPACPANAVVDLR